MQKSTKVKSMKLVDTMQDPYCILGIIALLLILNTLQVLAKWAQKKNVYICNFVGGLV